MRNTEPQSKIRVKRLSLCLRVPLCALCVLFSSRAPCTDAAGVDHPTAQFRLRDRARRHFFASTAFQASIISFSFTGSNPARSFVGSGSCGAGLADGIRCDTDGNVWIGAGWVGAGYDGVHIVSPDGTLIGQILLPEICSNLCFGGVKRNRLFMTGSQSLYSVYTEAIGAGIA